MSFRSLYNHFLRKLGTDVRPRNKGGVGIGQKYENIIAIKTVGNFINRSLVQGFVMNAEKTVIFLRKPQKITKTFVGSPKRLVPERDNTGVYTEIFKNIPKKFQFFIVIQKTAP